MSKSILTLGLIFLLSWTDSFSQPIWVKSKSSPNYPDRLYILGVGFANKTKDRAADKQKAYDAAFADIAKQIKSTIESQSSLQTYEVLSEKKNALEETTSAEIKVSTEVKLGGLRVVDTYYDDDNELEWALAVLERTTAGDQLRTTIVSYLAAYNKSIENSTAFVSSGNLYHAILNLTDALKSQVLYNNLLPVYNFITGPLSTSDSSYVMPGTLLVSDTKAAAQSFLSSIKLDKTEGDTQSVSVKSEPRPLIVTASCSMSGHKIPVSGLKIKFEFRRGRGTLTDESITDASGKARCDIFTLLPSRSNVYSISATQDLSEFKIEGEQYTSGEFQDWNNFLDKNQTGILFNLMRSSASLEDRLAEAVLELSTRIRDTSASVAIARISFQDKLPGPIAEFLRQKIESVIQSSTELSVISEEAIRNSQIQLSDGGSLQSLSQPDFASQAAGARYSIVGSYWKEGESLNLSLKVIDVETHLLTGSASIDVPLSWLPPVPLAPENYNPVADDKIIGNEKKGEGLKIDVWVDRLDGVYHDGDTMSIYIRSTGDCYAQLVYNDAGGNSVLVFPNKVSWNSRVKGGVTYRIPGTFVVQAPFGREILKVYASDVRVPVAQGKEIGNLIVLNSANDFQSATRTAGLSGENYSENSVVITTMPKRDRSFGN
ncbi:MAG TPA: DUF4384 domain-containing protein [Candidatus Kryptonia bacterium]